MRIRNSTKCDQTVNKRNRQKYKRASRRNCCDWDKEKLFSCSRLGRFDERALFFFRAESLVGSIIAALVGNYVDAIVLRELPFEIRPSGKIAKLSWAFVLRQ